MRMPQAVVWMLGAVGAAIVAKLIVKEWQRINDELDQSRPAPADIRRAGAPVLRPDPETGVYRPKG
jgi:hypothetical protein